MDRSLQAGIPRCAKNSRTGIKGCRPPAQASAAMSEGLPRQARPKTGARQFLGGIAHLADRPRAALCHHLAAPQATAPPAVDAIACDGGT